MGNITEEGGDEAKQTKVGRYVSLTKNRQHHSEERERRCKMSKRKFLILMSLILALSVVAWGIDLGYAQQAPGSAPQTQPNLTELEKFQEELAARRAAQGQMRSTTDVQRKAAAERNAARRAKALQANPQGEVTK